MKTVWVVLLGLGLTLGGGRAEGRAAGEREPTYQGKSLRAWIRDVKDPDPVVRLQAVGALGHMRRAEAAVPALIEALKDRDSYVREDAAFALGHIGPKARQAVPALLEALKDRDVSVRKKAAAALGKIGVDDEAVINALADSLKEKDVRLRAAKALEGFGPKAKPAVPALIAMLKDPAHSTSRMALARIYAAEALGGIGPDAREAVPALKQALKDKDPRVREAVAQALQRIDPDAASKASAP